MSAVAERMASDIALSGNDSALDVAAPTRRVEPDRTDASGGLIEWLCGLLQETISARVVVVISVDREVPRLVGARRSDLADDTLAALDRIWNAFKDLVDGVADLSRSVDLFDAEPYTAVPLREGGRLLGLLVVDNASVKACEWSVVSKYASAVGQCLNQEEASRRREERLVAARVALVQAIHDSVLQDLFGISLALDGTTGRSTRELRTCAANMRCAVGELRSLLDQATREVLPTDSAVPPLSVLAEFLRAEAEPTHLEFELEPIDEVPADIGVVAARFIGEGVRNALKHADPTFISVRATLDRVLQVCVENDGVRPDDKPSGIGLRLLGLDAGRLGGFISADQEEDLWRLTLTMPAATPL